MFILIGIITVSIAIFLLLSALIGVSLASWVVVLFGVAGASFFLARSNFKLRWPNEGIRVIFWLAVMILTFILLYQLIIA